ncbi:nuclear transport factor 2 family protein [Ornithinimicrobium ciconiae]|uniref:Nuclear transport factor 2 family protein n=1 Tax=Ornithinimicrobium ciconiae TaxID=2594265 RepID=A0A516GAX4_9MICO|nr:nuclear transport factor 2 family protein [Ornithinimicrobium ciconiae]QDO88684.1 nuclear transport factor 2 family protein [Ornithinimicrobium ciconiae]
MDSVLAELFVAENARDWATFHALLHSEVEWTLIGPDATAVVLGRSAYMDRILAAYESAPGARFSVRRSLRNEAGMVVTELIDNHGDVSIDVFDVRDGQVRRQWEFLLGSTVR